MKNRQDYDSTLFMAVKHRVRKSPNLNAPDRIVFGRVTLRVFGHQLGRTHDFFRKLKTQTWLPLLVPHCRIVEFVARSATKNNGQAHLFSRALIEE